MANTTCRAQEIPKKKIFKLNAPPYKGQNRYFRSHSHRKMQNRCCAETRSISFYMQKFSIISHIVSDLLASGGKSFSNIVHEYLYFLFILNKSLPLTSSLETAEDFCQTNAESVPFKLACRQQYSMRLAVNFMQRRSWNKIQKRNVILNSFFN